MGNTDLRKSISASSLPPRKLISRCVKEQMAIKGRALGQPLSQSTNFDPLTLNPDSGDVDLGRAGENEVKKKGHKVSNLFSG